MVVINFDDQILPGTFEHALHYLIEHKVDLSEFHAAYCNTHEGRPAIDPAILLKIILFAYSKGITSSRHIQWFCQSNIIFKALSCDTSPDFTTIAAFVSGHCSAIVNLFEQVVLICHEQGLIGVVSLFIPARFTELIHANLSRINPYLIIDKIYFITLATRIVSTFEGLKELPTLRYGLLLDPFNVPNRM